MAARPWPARSMRRSAAWANYEHALACWLGVAAVTAGTLMQLPMYFIAEDTGYMLRGMSFDATMTAGMVLIFVGIGLTAVRVVSAPRQHYARTGIEDHGQGSRRRSDRPTPMSA